MEYMKIKDIVCEAEKSDFIFAVCLFLEDFNHCPDRASLIDEEPAKAEYLCDIDYASMAAIAHKLAIDNNIKVPSWVYKRCYYLDEPYYEFNTKNEKYREYLKIHSLPEFSSRNLFVDENAIMRV